ncbi:MAG: hypothetical protein SFX18_06820 [Pirellulales bacterium]|nr:hypothetical protein [Pirellulales bacterium]
MPATAQNFHYRGQRVHFAGEEPMIAALYAINRAANHPLASEGHVRAARAELRVALRHVCDPRAASALHGAVESIQAFCATGNRGELQSAFVLVQQGLAIEQQHRLAERNWQRAERRHAGPGVGHFPPVAPPWTTGYPPARDFEPPGNFGQPRLDHWQDGHGQWTDGHVTFTPGASGFGRQFNEPAPAWGFGGYNPDGGPQGGLTLQRGGFSVTIPLRGR